MLQKWGGIRIRLLLTVILVWPAGADCVNPWSNAEVEINIHDASISRKEQAWVNFVFIVTSHDTGDWLTDTTIRRTAYDFRYCFDFGRTMLDSDENNNNKKKKKKGVAVEYATEMIYTCHMLMNHCTVLTIFCFHLLHGLSRGIKLSAKKP